MHGQYNVTSKENSQNYDGLLNDTKSSHESSVPKLNIFSYLFLVLASVYVEINSFFKDWN